MTLGWTLGFGVDLGLCLEDWSARLNSGVLTVSRVCRMLTVCESGK